MPPMKADQQPTADGRHEGKMSEMQEFSSLLNFSWKHFHHFTSILPSWWSVSLGLWQQNRSEVMKMPLWKIKKWWKCLHVFMSVSYLSLIGTSAWVQGDRQSDQHEGKIAIVGHFAFMSVTYLLVIRWPTWRQNDQQKWWKCLLEGISITLPSYSHEEKFAKRLTDKQKK